MSTTADRLSSVRAKIERAKHHVRDLESRILAFRATDPYALFCDDDPKTGDRVLRVHVRSQPPDDLALIAGEIIYQLRSSLDHLAWQLVEANGGVPGQGTYFPIAETAAKYIAKAPGQVQGMSAAAISMIDAIQPYMGGCNDLWRLHALSNYDKHRLLLVIAFGFGNLWYGRTLPSQGVRQMATFRLTLTVVDPAAPPPPSLSSSPVPKFPILQDGAEAARVGWQTDPQMKEYLNLTYEIAFGKPQIVEGEPVLPLLHQLAHLANSIVDQFVPLL